jgi:alpha-mannosidase
MHLTVEQRVQRLEARLGELEFWRVRSHFDLVRWSFDGERVELGSRWPRLDGVPVLAHERVRVPDDWDLDAVGLELDLGGEGLLRIDYADGGRERFGLDPFHTRFPLTHRAFGIELEAVARLPLGVPNRSATLRLARVAWFEPMVERMQRLLALVVETVRSIGDHDAVDPILERAERSLTGIRWPSRTDSYVSRTAPGPVMQGIWALPSELDPEPEGLDDEARASLDRAATGLSGDLRALRDLFAPRGSLLLSGHAHLDLAWLWPIEETRRKARRTYYTVTGLMGRYPELTFNQSSAQLYAFVEEDDPELFETIRESIGSKRWEPIGGMWVEPDTNMPCGESLVRQLLYGQRYFQSRFGSTHDVCWLPDCFGFTPALPQLLLGAGISGFFTHKLNWSETNRFPYDLFWWEGLDGSRVLAHGFNNPAGGYNGVLGPAAAVGTWTNYQQKGKWPKSLLTIGHGDGAGGPTGEMVERGRELASFPLVPEMSFGRVSEFYGEVLDATEGPDLPWWSGELYFEFHRGTLTSQGRLKRLHRRAERDLIAAETLASVRHLLGGPRPDSLEHLWHILLRNQFHDILPGSSVREVNEHAEAELAEVVDEAGGIIASELNALEPNVVKGGDEVGVLVFNPDASSRPLRLQLDDDLPGGQPVAGGSVVATEQTVPGLSAAVILDFRAPDGLAVSNEHLENDFLRVSIEPDGSVGGILDKHAAREALAGRGNQLWAYVDKPRAWDAWDVDAGYADDGVEITGAESLEVVERGPHRAALRIARRFRNSSITQELRLWANSARLDVHTLLEWGDRHWLLKSLWPVAVHSRVARFETAFGVVERPTHRNTSWDAAQFEVAGHRFVDLSEPGYGVALLNDGRYGHHVLRNEIGLSLLRSPAYPDPLADEGHHELTYAILPHRGGWLEGGVLAEAEDLNRPLPARRVAAAAASINRGLRLDGLPVAVGALKIDEDEDDALVLRLYEPQGGRGDVSVELPSGWTLDADIDLLERGSEPPGRGFTPFAVRSWRLRRAQ